MLNTTETSIPASLAATSYSAQLTVVFAGRSGRLTVVHNSCFVGTWSRCVGVCVWISKIIHISSTVSMVLRPGPIEEVV